MEYTRGYFTSGVDGVLGSLFRTGNIPNQAGFTNLFDSVLFKKESGDTATTTKAGHAKVALDTYAALRSDAYTDGHERFVQAHQLPLLNSVLPGTHASVSTSTNNGITIDTQNYLVGGNIIRRDFGIYNDMTLASAGGSVTVTEAPASSKHFNIEVNTAYAGYGKVKVDAGATADYLGNVIELHHFLITAGDLLELRYQDTNSIDISDDASGIMADLIHANTSLETVAGGVQIRDNVDTITLTTTYLRTTGDQTVASGIKTFVVYPRISVYAAPTIDTQFAPKKYVDDLDALCVHLAGAEVISGSKEFNLFPWKTGPGLTPTLPEEFTTKYYVDSLLPSGYWEPGSAGTHSLTTINADTGCDATGNYSLAAGRNALASGTYSFAFGYNVTASGTNSIAIGNSSLASSNISFVIGSSSEVTASGAFAIGGSYNFAKSALSYAFGNFATSAIIGARAHSSHMFGALGDDQEVVVPMCISTTDATATDLRLVDITNTGITIPTDCSAKIYAEVVGVRTGGTDATGALGDTASQIIKATVKDVGGTLTFVPCNTVTLANYSFVDAAGEVLYELAHYDVNFINGGAFVDGTNILMYISGNELRIKVTGEAAKNIRWTAKVRISWIGWRNFSI